MFSRSFKILGAVAALLILSVSVSSHANQFHIPAVEQAAKMQLPVVAKTKAPAVDDQAILNRAQVSDVTLDEDMSPSALMHEMGIPLASFFRAHINYTNRLTIIVNKANYRTSPTAQQMNVYLDGQLIHTFPVSTGREKEEEPKVGDPYFSTTPVGDFRIEWRDINHYSGQWLAPMPYAQFFSDGVAIHATVPAHYARLGHRDSGGCVRLRLENAKIMWDLVSQVGVENTLIRIINQPY